MHLALPRELVKKQMEIVVSEAAEKNLDEMNPQLRIFFLKHIEKIGVMPPRRHLCFGLPFNVINITKQARLIYQFEGDTLFVLRCFATHKEYERWYLSFR